MITSMVTGFGITVSAGEAMGQILTASTPEELKSALEAAESGDTVKLTADIFNYDEYFEAINSSDYCYTVTDKAITLDIGTYSLYGGSSDYEGGESAGVLTLDNATVTLNGTTGTIRNYEVGNNAVTLRNGSVLNVNGGTVWADNSGDTFRFYDGTVNIYGGTVQGYYIDAIPAGTDFESGAINIYDGNIAVFNGDTISSAEEQIALTISAGAFNICPKAAQLAAGSNVIDLGTGEDYRYRVTKPEIYLDLDDTTTDILEKKELDQNYNLTVTVGAKTNVTKVKLTWEISDINATRTDNMIWDTDELKWVAASSSTAVTDNGTATFTLENYSSVEVDAEVTFATAEYEEGKKFAAPTLTYNEGTNTAGTDDGKITLDTANGSSTYSKTNVPTGVIAVTVAPDDTDAAFKALEATTAAARYGTYTVTLKKSVAASFLLDGFFNGEKGDATVNGKDATALCQYMTDNGMITDASQFGTVLVKSTYYSKLQKKTVTVSKTLSLLFDTTHQEEGTATSDTLAGDNDYTEDKAYVVYFNGTFTWDGSAFVKSTQ